MSHVWASHAEPPSPERPVGPESTGKRFYIAYDTVHGYYVADQVNPIFRAQAHPNTWLKTRALASDYNWGYEHGHII